MITPRSPFLKMQLSELVLQRARFGDYRSKRCSKGHVPSDKKFENHALWGLFGKARHFRSQKKTKEKHSKWIKIEEYMISFKIVLRIYT